ncbi:MAG: amidohydrolase family protein [Candidatus Wallbacteria bacterium]|nr:amidohydrolase family protein [Candidatus Wallbacteria bacterium]
MDLVIKNGVVVGPGSQFEADLGIEGGRIVQLADKIEPGSAEVLEARGMFVLPGAIDLHTHIGLGAADDFESGTRAAARGGVTCIVDCAPQLPGKSLLQSLEVRKSEAAGRAYVDFALHAAPAVWSEAVRREIREAVAEGITTFEVQLAPSCIAGLSALADAALYELLHETAKVGATVIARPGNAGVASAVAARLRPDGLADARRLSEVFPAVAEAEGIRRVAALAELVTGNLLAGPVSGAEAAAAVAEARARGINVTGETAPHYLLRALLGEERPELAVLPPLRTAVESEQLWHALAGGDIEVVSSGHRARAKAGTSGKDVLELDAGLPGVELLLPLLFSEGVRRGRMTMSRLSQVTSTNPAMVAGLFPGKGILQIGSDADIVLLDPERDWTVSRETLATVSDLVPFDGLALKGCVFATVSRGKIVRRGEEFLGQPGHGVFVRRQPLEELY